MSARAAAEPAGGFRNIAVIRLSSLGDVVLTLPVVHALRRRWPAARIACWVKEEYADVVRHDASVTHVRVLERDARRFEDLISMGAELEDCDLIVDLHGSLRSRLLTFRQRGLVLRAGSHRLGRARWVYARWAGPPAVPHALERYAAALAPLGLAAPGPPAMAVGHEAEGWAGEWMRGVGGERVVALCPGARHATKRWPERHWVELLARLTAAGRVVVVMSTAAEREALPALDREVGARAPARWLVEPLPRLAAVLSRCAAAVTNDSGLMHVAAARGTRVVALFGSTTPELGFAPAGVGHAVLRRHEPCQPCTLHGRAVCPKGHFRCLEALEPGTVVAALAVPPPA